MSTHRSEGASPATLSEAEMELVVDWLREDWYQGRGGRGFPPLTSRPRARCRDAQLFPAPSAIHALMSSNSSGSTGSPSSGMSPETIMSTSRLPSASPGSTTVP